jgi:hypothetical protein
MLVLALQFSRDASAVRIPKVGILSRGARYLSRPGTRGMTEKKEHDSFTTEQERPAQRVPVVPLLLPS